MKKALSIGLIVMAIVAGAYIYTSGRTGTAVAGVQAGGGGLSDLTELLAGTLELEETDQAVTAEQAPELLTLWKAYLTLDGEDTTSDEELAALVQQVAGEMTTEQMAAVEAMSLSNEDLAAILQAQGVQVAGVAAGEAAGSAAAPSGGEMVAGGEAMAGVGGDMTGQMTGMTAGAATGETGAEQAAGGDDATSTAMLEAVITVLDAKVA